MNDTIAGDLWGAAARDWAELQESCARPLWEAMLEALHVGDGTRLLDAGCGAGGASVLAGRRGARITCFDASPNLLGIARERVPRATCVLGDLQALPFDDATFNAVLACNSVQYCADVVRALREMRRVCTRDGSIALATWAPAQECDMREIFTAVANVLPEPPSNEGPFALSAPGQMESLLERTALHFVERRSVDCPFYYPDPQTYWRAIASAGPLQAAIRTAGEQRVKSAVLEAAEPYRTSGGGFRLDNRFIFVIANPQRARS